MKTRLGLTSRRQIDRRGKTPTFRAHLEAELAESTHRWRRRQEPRLTHLHRQRTLRRELDDVESRFQRHGDDFRTLEFRLQPEGWTPTGVSHGLSLPACGPRQ